MTRYLLQATATALYLATGSVALARVHWTTDPARAERFEFQTVADGWAVYWGYGLDEYRLVPEAVLEAVDTAGRLVLQFSLETFQRGTVRDEG